MPREAKLVGFAVLLIAIFLGAHAAGSVLGPVTTSHSQVTYTGTGTGSKMGGMNMGGSPAPATPAARSRGARQ